MTQSRGKKTDFTGCCFESDFKFPMGKAEEMSEIMKNCCTEGGSFDCKSMMEMFKDDDGSFDVSRMMKVMRQIMPREK